MHANSHIQFSSKQTSKKRETSNSLTLSAVNTNTQPSQCHDEPLLQWMPTCKTKTETKTCMQSCFMRLWAGQKLPKQNCMRVLVPFIQTNVFVDCLCPSITLKSNQTIACPPTVLLPQPQPLPLQDKSQKATIALHYSYLNMPDRD